MVTRALRRGEQGPTTTDRVRALLTRSIDLQRKIAGAADDAHRRRLRRMLSEVHRTIDRLEGRP